MGGRPIVRIMKAAAVLAVVLVALGALARALVPRFMICLPASLRMNVQTGCWVLASQDRSGATVAVIGPLPVAPDTKYTADYMEGTFSPGMRSMARRRCG